MRGNVNMNEQNNSYCRACVAFFSLLWFSLMMCIVYPGTTLWGECCVIRWIHRWSWSRVFKRLTGGQTARWRVSVWPLDAVTCNVICALLLLRLVFKCCRLAARTRESSRRNHSIHSRNIYKTKLYPPHISCRCYAKVRDFRLIYRDR